MTSPARSYVEPEIAMNLQRKLTRSVVIGNVTMGGSAPVVVQAMTNTDTADALKTAIQVAELARSGAELVRITVNTPEAAAAVPEIRAQLDRMHCDVPLIGDFHYNGHRLLTDYPACAEALAKFRINPGNVGFGKKKDEQFSQMIELAIRYDKPVRIGVNWGSLDQSVLARVMDENAQKAEPGSASDVMREALILSALESAALAEQLGLSSDRIVLSCKVSSVQDLIASGPNRSGHGLQGDRRLNRRHGRAVTGRHRRHDPRVVDAGAEWLAYARSAGCAGVVANHGAPRLHAVGDRVPWLWPHDERALPGTGL